MFKFLVLYIFLINKLIVTSNIRKDDTIKLICSMKNENLAKWLIELKNGTKSELKDYIRSYTYEIKSYKKDNFAIIEIPTSLHAINHCMKISYVESSCRSKNDNICTFSLFYRNESKMNIFLFRSQKKSFTRNNRCLNFAVRVLLLNAYKKSCFKK
jgi:hypothetical protein